MSRTAEIAAHVGPIHLRGGVCGTGKESGREYGCNLYHIQDRQSHDHSLPSSIFLTALASPSGFGALSSLSLCTSRFLSPILLRRCAAALTRPVR